MAVPEQTPYIEYDGNGVSKVFPLTFDCEDSDHLIVKVNDEMPVVGAWSLVDEKVVFINAPAIDSKIVIQRNTPTKRSATYNSYDNSFRPAPVDSDFDTIWRKLQELGVTNWLTDTDIKNLGIYVNSLNDETRDDFFNSLGNLEKNTNAMLEEAIANGAVSALAITTVETVDELEDLNAWEGRTVSVTSIGNYKYKSSTQTWERDFITDRQVVTVNSIAELLTLPMWEGRVVNVISYYQSDYSSPVLPIIEGGDLFRYVYSLRNINDGGVCINGWMRQKATYNYLTPEMFGAKGIGSAFNDYQPMQNMFDTGAVGCTFAFDPAKTYYNGFENELTDPWQDQEDRKHWIRNKRCIFKFNGAKLTRRTPRWNDANNHDDYNSGQFYTEDRTALLKISGAGPWYMHDANFDSNVPFGAMLSHSGQYDYTDDTYCRGTCMDWGLRMESVTDFFCTNSIFQRSVFCVSAIDCSNINFTVPTFKYGAQAEKRVNENDLALGAGIKLERCKGVKLLGVYGYKNANDTVELERDNDDVTVTGSSDYDVANSLMLYSSSNVKLDWTGTNIIKGTGVSLIQSGEHSSNFVTGRINIQNCYGTGVLIRNYDDVSQDLLGIDLDITTQNCAYGGLIIRNTHNTYMPRGLKIHHNSIHEGGWLAASRMFEGKMTGEINGETIRDANSFTHYGFVIAGSNTADTCLRLNIDVSQAQSPYTVAPTAYCELFGTRLSWGTFYLTAKQVTNLGNTGPGLNYGNDQVGTMNNYANTIRNHGLYNTLDNLNPVSNNQDFALFYDANSGINDGTGKSYPVRIFIKD